MNTKQCNTCFLSFPRTTQYFHKHNQQVDGLFGKCKVCRNKKKRLEALTIKLQDMGMTIAEYEQHKTQERRRSLKRQKQKVRAKYRQNREQSLQATREHYYANRKQVSKRKANWYKAEEEEMLSLFQAIENYDFCAQSLVDRIEELNKKSNKGGWRQVAFLLNEEGFRTKRGKPWTRCSLNRLASSENIVPKWKVVVKK